MILSIHQPNLLMYSGVIEKIRRSDLFVVLTYAQFSRGNYHNRFELDGRWYTLSMNQRLEPLVDKRYIQPQKDWATIKRRLPAYVDILSDFDDCLQQNMVDANIAILQRVCDKLGITTPIVRDFPSSLTKTERLVELCRHYGADEYLSGPSGANYIDEEIFHNAGVGVLYQLKSSEPKAAIQLIREQDEMVVFGHGQRTPASTSCSP